MCNFVLIVAAGKGSRMNLSTPKQYMKFSNKTLIENTVEKFLSYSKSKEFDKIIVNVSPEDEYIDNINFNNDKVIVIKNGGKTRCETVKNALVFCESNFNSIDNILIHDAARPFVSHNLIFNILDELKLNKSVVPVLKLEQSIKKHDNYQIIENSNRDDFLIMQTPQGFDFKTIYQAHIDNLNFTLDDDIAVLVENKKDVYIKAICGEKSNIKITTKEDINNSMKTKTRFTSGIDIHKFKEGNYVVLCGIKIPHNKGIEAHSDGDVVFHALTDAMLAVLSAGDIGKFFPPSDEIWKGVDSKHFVLFANNMLLQNNITIDFIDITILAESPKISAYKDEMISNLSNILNLNKNQIAIKATTSEGLGFVGRKEGIFAQVNLTTIIKVCDE
jgi:2-C-methyl-D-erythritol 4-phosphate cytidylyltransferase/2-C-methyl-D-erythritol 2,4-cyclodiphosphate synthase